jgi:hypothetical protein
MTERTPRYTQHRSTTQGIGAIALNSTIVTLPLAVQTGDNLLLCKDIPTLVGGPDKCIKARISMSTPGRSAPQFSNSINVTLVDPNTHRLTVVPKQCVDVLPWVFQS